MSKLWLKIVLTLREEYEKVPHTTQNPLLSRFNYALLNLAEFFEAGGGGLKRSDIESKEFLVSKNLYQNFLTHMYRLLKMSSIFLFLAQKRLLKSSILI